MVEVIGTLDYTGERMVPERVDTRTFWEHVYRYRFAAQFAAGKRVLDIACGEGYGAAALREAGAASVIGVDISEEACEHARRKYGIDARQGSAENIPMQDESVDLIASFETIEHLTDPAAFLDECERVLAPAGVLVISTPNKNVFRAIGSGSSFHCSEMTESEFTSLLRARFRRCHFYGQVLAAAGWRSPRCIAALSAPWLRFRGALRLRQLVRRTLCPEVCGQLNQIRRQTAVQLVLRKDNPLCAFASPYRVWPRPSVREQPVFLIAVAEERLHQRPGRARPGVALPRSVATGGGA